MKIKFFSREKLKLIILFSFILHLIASIYSVGYHHRDEHYQILEFAGLKTGINQPNDLAWEFKERVRPTVQPALAFLIIKTCQLAGIQNPFDQVMIMRILSAIFSILCMFLLYLAFENEIISNRLKGWFLFFSFYLCFLFYLQVRFSSENWSGLLFFTGFALYFYKNIRHSFLLVFSVGFLIGLSFLFRYQSGFLAFGFILWLLFIKKENFKKLLILFGGIFVVILFGIFIDKWFYGEWTLTIWNYFNINLIQGKVSSFGTQPWYFYFTETLKQGLPPFSLVLVGSILIFFTSKFKSVFTWTLLPFILIHFIIGHKEFRFLFPIVNVIPLVFVLSLQEIIKLRDKYSHNKLSSLFNITNWKWLVYLFIIVNFIYLIIVCIRPADIYVSLYKYIYNNYHKNKTVLIYSEKDPYFVAPEPANFYKSKNLEEIKYSDSLDINLLMNKDKNVIFLSEDYATSNKIKLNGFTFTKDYRTLPDWILKFNINHWLERTKIFTIYKINPPF